MNKLYYATCQVYFEDILARELDSLGVSSTNNSVGGVFFQCSEEVLYRVLIYARTIAALRMVLLETDITNPQDLYQQALTIAWINYFSPDDVLACKVSSSGKNIAPENFLMLVMKDAIVDSFRKIGRARPNIDSEKATQFVHLYVVDNRAIITLELEHELFKRGYRVTLGEENRGFSETKLIKKNKNYVHPAPLKEHLAAALLYRARWPEFANEDMTFYDPMCGSGTIVLEAFMMVYEMSPHWLRKTWRIKNWKNFNSEVFDHVWHTMYVNAQKVLASKNIVFWASDINKHATDALRAAAGQLGVLDRIKIFHKDFFDIDTVGNKGFMVSNPPYGERMGTREDTNILFAKMGEHLKMGYQGWKISLLAPDSDILRCLDVRADKVNTFFNGSKRSVFLRFFIEHRQQEVSFTLSKEAQKVKYIMAKQFSNNQQLVKEKYHTNAFRFYSSDSFHYSAICEYFAGYVVVQEFSRKKDTFSKDTQVQISTKEVMHILQEITKVPKINIYHKVRRPSSSTSQYDKMDDSYVVRQKIHEGDLSFFVELSTYIDVGLYLDHRYLRREIMKQSKGKRFLNLYCYTASMSVAAAIGGATTTVSVDISNTYLRKAKANFQNNNISNNNHIFIRNEVSSYMKQLQDQDKFDIIYMDPPTFSNGKGRGILDIQKDHSFLINSAMKHLSKGGTLYFSTHYRRFKLDEKLENHFKIKDISKISHDVDFPKGIDHFLWSIQNKDNYY